LSRGGQQTIKMRVSYSSISTSISLGLEVPGAGDPLLSCCNRRSSRSCGPEADVQTLLTGLPISVWNGTDRSRPTSQNEVDWKATVERIRAGDPAGQDVLYQNLATGARLFLQRRLYIRTSRRIWKCEPCVFPWARPQQLGFWAAQGHRNTRGHGASDPGGVLQCFQPCSVQ